MGTGMELHNLSLAVLPCEYYTYFYYTYTSAKAVSSLPADGPTQ